MFARSYSPLYLLRAFLLGLALLAATPAAHAQGTIRRHLITFRDKAGTPYSVSQPLQYLAPRAVARRQRQAIAVLPRDLPPTPGYVQQVRAVPGVAVIYRTRWFNGVIVECDSSRLRQVQALPFVRGARTLNRVAAATRARAETRPARAFDAQRPTSANPYGIAFAQAEQIGATTMHAAGFRGEGMHVAIFDAGFPGVETIPAFRLLFQQNRLLSTFDAVRGGTSVYDLHPHGTMVLSTMAANQPNSFIGTAPMASYHLIRTEDTRGGTETPAEEAYWLIGAEYADSAGVDVINSSLGYHDFDAPAASYTYADMDGNTALSTRAADLACAVGILVVNSAGNDGDNSWRYVSAPADADSVLTVGAVDSLGRRAGFSSQGPTADGRIKPNVSTQGAQSAIIYPDGNISRGSGTSFAGPIMAGMAVGFWQANPTLTAQQVRRFLELSGSIAANPNNFLGYGIPNFRRAYNLANPNNPLGLPAAEGRSVPELYPNPVPGAAFALRLPARLIGQELTVQLTDAAGRVISEQLVKTVAGTDSVVITTDKNQLQAGLYLCLLRAASGEQHTLRFLKN
ncbi:MAG: S8 family serine peptidase [Hymenobacteraceae bacterium]|nr:S8 family serine peptidase [Hymenobacteraceae bacterium]